MAEMQLTSQYQVSYYKLQDFRKELEALQQQKKCVYKEYDYNKFLFDELQDVSFQPNELEEAEGELKLLSNSEGIKTILTKVAFELNESDEPMVQELKSLQNQVAAISSFHPDLEIILKRMQSAQIELQDIADEVERINDHVNYEPRQIERLNERISAGTNC